jgi:hypothetical protein
MGTRVWRMECASLNSSVTVYSPNSRSLFKRGALHYIRKKTSFYYKLRLSPGSASDEIKEKGRCSVPFLFL